MHAQNTFPDQTVWIFYILVFLPLSQMQLLLLPFGFLQQSIRIHIHSFFEATFKQWSWYIAFFESAIICTLAIDWHWVDFGILTVHRFTRASPYGTSSRQLLFINSMFLPFSSWLQGKCLSREEHFRLKPPKRIDLEHVNHLFANITSFVPSSSSVAFIAIWQQELLLSIFKVMFHMCHSSKFCSDTSLSLSGHCESSLKKEIDMGQVIFILLFTTLYTKAEGIPPKRSTCADISLRQKQAGEISKQHTDTCI